MEHLEEWLPHEVPYKWKLFLFCAPKCHCEDTTRYYITMPGEVSFEHQDLFIIHLKSKFWSSSGICKGFSLLLAWLFSFLNDLILYYDYISFMFHQLQNVFLIHRSLLSSLNIHIYHYLSDISTLMAHRYLKCSMPTPKSLAAQPFFNLFSSGLSLLSKWYDGPS